MNKITVAGTVLAGLLAMSAVNAECTYPKAPTGLPDGATATQDEMVNYLNCLETEMNTRIEAAGPDAPPEQVEQIKAIHTKRHNAAVEELEANATRFNEQVKVYKARENKGKKS
jgi:hypothetical protein